MFRNVGEKQKRQNSLDLCELPSSELFVQRIPRQSEHTQRSACRLLRVEVPLETKDRDIFYLGGGEGGRRQFVTRHAIKSRTIY